MFKRKTKDIEIGELKQKTEKRDHGKILKSLEINNE